MKVCPERTAGWHHRETLICQAPTTPDDPEAVLKLISKLKVLSCTYQINPRFSPSFIYLQSQRWITQVSQILYNNGCQQSIILEANGTKCRARKSIAVVFKRALQYCCSHCTYRTSNIPRYPPPHRRISSRPERRIRSILPTGFILRPPSLPSPQLFPL